MKVGIDIVKWERMENIAASNQKMKKIFTAEEVAYIENKKDNKLQTIAGIYALKEATLKAFGEGICGLNSLKEIEVSHNSFGACEIVLQGNAKKTAKMRGYIEIIGNISHDGGISAAICVIR
mgnify:CR=1 FL=1